MIMKIFKWKRFIEAISGTFDTMPFGPNSPRQELPVTLSKSQTELIEGLDGKIYNNEQFFDLYNLYLKNNGKENLQDFTKENLDKLIKFLNLI